MRLVLRIPSLAIFTGIYQWTIGLSLDGYLLSTALELSGEYTTKSAAGVHYTLSVPNRFNQEKTICFSQKVRNSDDTVSFLVLRLDMVLIVGAIIITTTLS